MNYFPYSGDNFAPATTITTATTGTAFYPLYVPGVGSAPDPTPEDEMAWLRRRISEVTELVAV